MLRNADISCLPAGMSVCIPLSPAPEGRNMPTSPVPEGRRLKRIAARKRASLVFGLDRNPKRVPCLVVDVSERGFRLHGNFRLRRGQAVELILDEEPLSAVRCNVVWIGKPGSKQEGEAGLETV